MRGREGHHNYLSAFHQTLGHNYQSHCEDIVLNHEMMKVLCCIRFTEIMQKQKHKQVQMSLHLLDFISFDLKMKMKISS